MILINIILIILQFNIPMSPIKKLISAQNTPLPSRRPNEVVNNKSARSSSVDLLESCTIRRKVSTSII